MEHKNVNVISGLAPQTTFTSLDSQPGCSHWTHTSGEVTSQEPQTSQSVPMRIQVKYLSFKAQ